MFETRSIESRCPICEAEAVLPVAPYNGYAMGLCRECDFLCTTQRSFPPGLYADTYASDGTYRYMVEVARRTALGKMGFNDLWWYKRMALRWLHGNGKKRRLLDVGCGPGTFLLVSRDRGWCVEGIEPTSEPAVLAASFGLEVYNGYVEDYRLREPFDAITCFEVLEHVSNPVAMLRRMRELLKRDGRLILSVPNRDDPFCLRQHISSAMPPVHINFFNERSLRSALAKAGFEAARFKTLPIPTSSVRNMHGRMGLICRVPWLVLLRIAGRADGTTIVAQARPRSNLVVGEVGAV